MSQSMDGRTIVPVILCGGSGTRLWPASRETMPKQFLTLLGEKSLLQNTFDRALKLAGCEDNIVIVTTRPMERQVYEQLADRGHEKYHIVVEPCARNTAPAIAMATRYILDRFGPDTILCILPSDHHIEQENNLYNCLHHAFGYLYDSNIMTFGIRPDSARTDYGYITIDKNSSGPLYRANHFREKPPQEEAQALYESGASFWNSGIYCLTLQSALHHFRACSPILYENLVQAPRLHDGFYDDLPPLSFDREITERSDNVFMLPVDLDWMDIGSWDSLWATHPKDDNNNVLLGKTFCLDSKGCYVHAHTRTIAIAGLQDIAVIETPDMIFITPRSASGLHRKMAVLLSESSDQEDPIDIISADSVHGN